MLQTFRQEEAVAEEIVLLMEKEKVPYRSLEPVLRMAWEKAGAHKEDGTTVAAFRKKVRVYTAHDLEVQTRYTTELAENGERRRWLKRIRWIYIPSLILSAFAFVLAIREVIR